MSATPHHPRMIGYARVSKIDQNLDLQLDALRAEGCEAIYADHGVSGTKRKRPEFDKALKSLRAGDTLVVWKLDRMSRSLRDLLDIVEEIHGRDAHFKCLTDQIDTTNPMGEFFFHILASLAHFERRLISERTKAGLEAARKRGVRLGRPPRDRFALRGGKGKVRRISTVDKQGMNVRMY